MTTVTDDTPTTTPPDDVADANPLPDDAVVGHPDLAERIALRLAELTQQLAAIPELGQRPLSMTLAESRALDLHRAELELRIRHVRSASDALTEYDDLVKDERWLKFLTDSRAALCTELLEMPSPIRRREDRLQHEGLTSSIQLIDRGLGISTLGMIVDLSPTRIGALMAAEGYTTTGDALRGPQGWRGPLPEVERRIAVRKQKHTQTLAQLEQALMSDDARQQREQQHATYRAALRGIVIQLDADGRSLVAFTWNGEPLPREHMTPAQREAFDWMVRTNETTTSRTTSPDPS